MTRLSAAMTVLLVLAAPTMVLADGAEDALRQRLRPHYTALAARAGIELPPNTPLWERSFEATIRATIQAMDQGVTLGLVPRSFTMPTFGMEPTIRQGEVFYALEDYYRAGEPQRGDVVLYRLPKQGLSYVRRVIALPGESIEITGGVPVVAGRRAERERLGIFVDLMNSKSFARYRERVGDGPSYEVASDAAEPRIEHFPSMTLAPNTYFVLGDNREEVPETAVAELAVVRRENILDKPQIIWLSKDLSRIGTPIQPR